MKPQSSPKSHLTALTLATVVSIALWFLPFLRWVTVPVQYLNTHIHEACHAITAVATGGVVSHIEVHANGNGETYTGQGIEFLISSAGYVGASLVGALIIALARTPKAAKVVLVGLGVTLIYSLIVWVRGDLFGQASCVAWIVALWAMAFYLDDDKRLFAAQLIGVQQCVNSIQSVFFLIQISGFGVKQSDAGNMEAATHIPAIVWSVLWCAISLGLMFLALRLSWQASRRTIPSSKYGQESAS